jgi:hypothetical protein
MLNVFKLNAIMPNVVTPKKINCRRVLAMTEKPFELVAAEIILWACLIKFKFS